MLILLMRGDTMEKKRIMLYVDEEMYDKIKLLADKDKRSMNNYIVMVLEKELEAASK
jgi:predicted HicB family RNase H-like nuclease